MINRARPVWTPARFPATIKEPACNACPTYPPALQIWDGSLTQTAERLKTTISPFSYPRRPRFFNPFLASKTKRSSRSPCMSPGDPSTPTPYSIDAHASFGTEIASPQTHRDILGFTAVLTKQNTVCWCGGNAFLNELELYAIWRKSKVCGKISCKPCRRLYWFLMMLFFKRLSLSRTHTHTRTHTLTPRDTLSQARISFYRRETQVCW